MKKIILLVSLMLMVFTLKGQQGAPLLTDFKESSEIENQSWAICQDDNNVMLFANRRGILTFDGQSWNFIPIPTIPYIIKYNLQEKKVYVGGENNYGYMARDDKGIYRYFSISGEAAQLGLISKIIFTDSTVYFYGELSISRHDIKSGKLEFSGAYNPLFIFQGEEFREYRADRMPIGIYYGEKESFTNHEIDVQKGDTIYIFSDGFADQFGGPKGSKYMKYNLKKLLIEIHRKPMAEQRYILKSEFEKWKGADNQIDDVTILGVKI